MSQQQIDKEFPRLKRSDYTIKSVETASYNCVAWAFSDDTTRWDPTANPSGVLGYYWPRRMSRSIAVQNFVALFEQRGGFIKCENGDYEAGFEKIAIHEDIDGTFNHVSRMKANGVWTSKLGKLEDIDHADPFVLEPDYGKIVQFLKKPLNAKTQTS